MALLIAGSLAFYLTHPREPSYEGRTLTEWLNLYYRSFSANEPNRPALYDASTNAIKHIGTNAIPFLIKKLTSRETNFQKHLRLSIPKLPRSLLRVPFFQRSLIQFLSTTHGWDQFQGREGLKILGTDALSAVPALARLTKHPDPHVRAMALDSLRSIHPKPEIFLPILLQAMHDPDAGTQMLSAAILADLYPEEADYAGVYKLYPALKPADTNNIFTNQPFGQ